MTIEQQMIANLKMNGLLDGNDVAAVMEIAKQSYFGDWNADADAMSVTADSLWREVRQVARGYLRSHRHTAPCKPAFEDEEVVHRCPPSGEGLTPCCNKPPFELPHYHRLTTDDSLVTCNRGYRELIESPVAALEAMKELFRREATFGCEKIEAGWLIVIFDEGRSYADDSAGRPSEILNRELLGRVLAARDEARLQERR